MIFLVLYSLAAYTLFAVLGYQVIKPRISDRQFFFLSIVVLLVGRLPILLYNNELDADESQLLTQALTLAGGGIYLRDFDSTTIGPLATYMLATPALFGLPIDYLGAHWLAALLTIVTLWSFFRGAKAIGGSDAARLGLLTLTCFFGLTTSTSFLHFSSEVIPIAIYSLTMMLVIYQRRAATLSYSTVFLIAFLLGLLPYSKIQALPLAPAIALGLLFRKDFYRDVKGLFLLVLGGVIPTVAVLVYGYTHEILDEFQTYYITSNLKYGQMHGDVPLTVLPRKILGYFFISNPVFGFLLLLPGVLITVKFLLELYGRKVSLPEGERVGFVWLLLLVGTGTFTTLKPGTHYGHHLYHMILPMAYLVVFCAARWRVFDHATTRQLFLKGYVVFFALVSVGLLVKLMRMPFYRQMYTFENGASLASTGVSRFVKAHTAPGEPIAVWGWHCKFNVQSQRPQAVAENHVQRCVIKTSIQRTHQNRYLADIRRNRPAIFLDASAQRALSIDDSTIYRLSLQSGLHDFIKREYVYDRQIEKVHVYVRKDLYHTLTEHKQTTPKAAITN